jgi:hypothetical protein
LSQGKRIVEDPPDLRKEQIFALVIFGLAWCPILGALIVAPGFVTPFLNHPIARLIMLGLTMWQIVCCILISRTKNLNLQVLLAMVSGIPIVLGPMLGPAVITILGAFNLFPKSY